MIYDEKMPYWVELAKVVGPPTVVAIVSYFISRLNLNIKETEIHGQSKFKAKELIFNTYQKKLETAGKVIELQSQAIAKDYLSLHKTLDQSKGISNMKALLEIYDKHRKAHSEHYDELMNEAKKSKIYNDKIQSQIDFIRTTFSVEAKNLNDSEVENHFYNFAKANALVAKLEHDLLEQKCFDLFSEYM